MADSVWTPTAGSVLPTATVTSRHSAVVRATHWITALCFLALLVSGVEILISHPRFSESGTFGLCAKRIKAPERSASIKFAVDSTHLRTDSLFSTPRC
jgi:cytochrome b561